MLHLLSEHCLQATHTPQVKIRHKTCSWRRQGKPRGADDRTLGIGVNGVIVCECAQQVSCCCCPYTCLYYGLICSDDKCLCLALNQIVIFAGCDKRSCHHCPVWAVLFCRKRLLQSLWAGLLSDKRMCHEWAWQEKKPRSLAWASLAEFLWWLLILLAWLVHPRFSDL